jgi:hypothetical protein
VHDRPPSNELQTLVDSMLVGSGTPRPAARRDLPWSRLRSCGVGYAPMRQPLDVGGLVDRSLRDLGRILVVMGALLGAVLGVGLALIVENADTSGTVVASGPERAAVLASPPSSRPPASRVASSEGSAAGNGAAARQRDEAADQADHRDQKADKNRKGRPDKPGKGNVKPGKDKGR